MRLDHEPAPEVRRRPHALLFVDRRLCDDHLAEHRAAGHHGRGGRFGDAGPECRGLRVTPPCYGRRPGRKAELVRGLLVERTGRLAWSMDRGKEVGGDTEAIAQLVAPLLPWIGNPVISSGVP